MRVIDLWRLAETQAIAAALDDAIVTVEQALKAEPHNPPALRLRGELRLLRDAGGAARFELAEKDFRKAIKIARTISAKSWELRATTCLARLLRDTNRRAEARAMLADIYNWFTEGFDTADLKDAKALLDELTT